LAPLRWMLAENLARPADEPGRRLVSSSGHDVDVGEDLLAGEPPGYPLLVFELDGQELGHQVIGGVLAPPFDVVGVEVATEELAVAGVHRLALLRPEALVDEVAYLLLLGFGDPEQHADDAHRHLRAEVAHEIERAAADQRIEEACAVGPHLRFDGRHLARREDALDQASMDRMERRVLEEEDPPRHLETPPDELEHAALGRTERL